MKTGVGWSVCAWFHLTHTHTHTLLTELCEGCKAKQAPANTSFAYGHSLVTFHYGKYLITPSSAVLPAESLSHSLHISCGFSPPLARSIPLPHLQMPLGSSWRNSCAKAFYFSFQEQFLGIQQMDVCVKTVDLSSQLQIHFKKQFPAWLAGIQHWGWQKVLPRWDGSGAPQLQVNVSVAGTEQMHLGFGRDHGLTHLVWVTQQ